MHPSASHSSAKPFSWPKAIRARHIALPAEHGAWVFLFSPLLIGIAAGGFRLATLPLVVAALAGFLVRQPVTMAVKISAGRRSEQEMAPVVFWLAIYGLVGLAAVTILIVWGYGFLTWLALPALPVLAWHLWLVHKRAERRQMLVEIMGSGVLALAAPAAYWVGREQVSSTGWLLWGLSWLQIAGTILYAYLRLEQRVLKQRPARSETIALGWPALLYNLTVFLIVLGLAFGKIVPRLLPIAFFLQPLEVVWGMFNPAVGMKPKAIGLRQLAISVSFTLLFVLTWFL